MSTSHEAVSSDPGSEAEAVYVEFMRAREAGEGAGIEALCGERPELADELRRLHGIYSYVERIRTSEPEPDAEESRYQLRGEIGRGGMGIVFDVWDRRLRRSLAMKVCRAEDSAERASPAQRRARYRFLEEAQITAQLDHPGVVPIYELGVDPDGHAFFAMRKVAGRTFGEILRLVRERADGWSRERALGVLVRVCETLAFAHSRGVVHRDIKPSNVMVGAFHEVYVMDWGLAKVQGREADSSFDVPLAETSFAGVTSVRTEALDETPESPLRTEQGSVLGTPPYMSPEQAEGRREELGPATDIYSVGAILYQVATGELPYGAEQDKVAAIRSGPPRPMHLVRSDVPAELESICEKAMARDPARRYATMDALAGDLRAFLEGRVVRAHATGAWIETRKWVSRNRALATALALVILTLAASSWLSLRHIRALEAADAETRSEAYAASIASADLALRQSDVVAARRSLEACPEALRGWEWSHLASRLDESVAVLGKELHPRDVGFSPDGALLAACFSKTLVVWELAGGDEVARLPWDGTALLSSVFLPDGRTLVVGDAEGRLMLYDTGSWLEKEVLRAGDGEVRGLAVAPGGELYAHAVGLRVQVRAVSDHALVADLDGPEEQVWDVAWSPTGERVAACGQDGTVRTWSVERGEQEVLIQAHPEGWRTHQGWGLSWSPDGKLLAATGRDGAVLAWDARTGALEDRLAYPAAWAFDVDYLRDGRLAVADGEATIGIVDLAAGEVRDRLIGHTSFFGSGVAQSPDGSMLASNGGQVRLWSTDFDRSPSLPGEESIACLAASNDGERVVLGMDDSTVRVHRAATGEEVLRLQALEQFSAMVTMSDDGERIYATGMGPGRAGEACVWIWDAASGELLRKLSAPGRFRHGIAVDPGERWVASTSQSFYAGDLIVWDVASGAVVHRSESDESLSPFPCFSPDGRWFAYGDGSRLVLLSVPDFERVELRGHSDLVWGVAFDPRGACLASASFDQTARLWSGPDWSCDAVLRGHTHQVHTVDFSPDGTRLLTASGDATARLWDTRTRRQVYWLRHPGWVRAARFALDGALVVTASLEGAWMRDAELRAEWMRADRRREASRPLVDRLFEELELREDVLAALASRDDLTREERDAALSSARSRSRAPEQLDAESRAVVLDDGASVAELARALRKAEVAVRATLDLAPFHNTLGVAQYRSGAFREALATLRRADELNRGYHEPYHRGRDVAWIALALVELGEPEAARDALAEVAALGEPDEETRRFLARARARLP